MPKPGTSCKLLKATVPFVVDQLSQRASNLSVTVMFTFTSAVTHLKKLGLFKCTEVSETRKKCGSFGHMIFFTTNEETKKSIKI